MASINYSNPDSLAELSALVERTVQLHSELSLSGTIADIF